MIVCFRPSLNMYFQVCQFPWVSNTTQRKQSLKEWNRLALAHWCDVLNHSNFLPHERAQLPLLHHPAFLSGFSRRNSKRVWACVLQSHQQWKHTHSYSPRLWLLGRAHCQSPRQHRYRCCCRLRYTTNCLLFREMPMDILSSRGRIPGKQGGMHVVRNWHPSMQIPCTRAAQEAAAVCTTAGTELARPPRNTTDSKVTTVSNELLWLWGILPRQICFHFLFWTRSGIWQAEKLLLGKDVMSCSQKSSHCLQDFDSCDHLMLT